MLAPDYPVIIGIMRETWTERLVQDGNKAAGQRDRHDIMVEQGNKELLPAIVLPSCSGLGSVSIGFLCHTHKHTLDAVKLNLRAKRPAFNNMFHDNDIKYGLKFYYRLMKSIKCFYRVYWLNFFSLHRYFY